MALHYLWSESSGAKSQKWLLLLWCLLCCSHTGLLLNCHQNLGGYQEQNSFVCSPHNRVSSDIMWFRDGVELIHGEKYSITPTSLTVNNIVSSDEGNYSCKYMATSSQYEDLLAGCLLVYGAGFFDADEDNIKVKDDGRIHFNLSLTFSMSGASGLVQEIVRFVLIKDNAVIVQCPVDINETPCTFSGADDSQWWTVEIEEGGRHVLFVLHQAMSSDRGSYTAIYEGSDPATDSLNTGRKTIHVTAFDCAEPFPSISGGSALYLESTDSDIEGAQVNYTCNRSCTLQGSFSLRCRVSVNNGHLMSEWIDDMGDSATPRCICQDTSLSNVIMPATPIMSLAVSKTDDVKGSKNPMESPTGMVESNDKKQTGLNKVILAGIVIGVSILTIIIFSLIVLALWFCFIKRHKQKAMELNKEGMDAGYKMEVVETHGISTDALESVNDSDRSSADDNDRDSFIETLANGSFSEHPKNSHATLV